MKARLAIFAAGMEQQKQHIIRQMNELGSTGEPFVFLIDFGFQKPLIFDAESSGEICWQTPGAKNFADIEPEQKPVDWNVSPIGFGPYREAFERVQAHIRNGDTYLLNLTMPSRIETNLSPEEIFRRSRAPYKIWLKDEFVCFSPEIFVRIHNGLISSYPMKGTIDASMPDAAQKLRTDEKEVAEHHTIVDLIRNDLSMVATEVTVEKLMYLDQIGTNRGEILQMSSKISGKLPADYPSKIGDIVAKLLPAGSICGAPKPKTVEIIRSVEPGERGYYTGVFGYFDGQNLDSCVLIRYIDLQNGEMVFRSGGGITFMSDTRAEYDELIRKVYVPIG